MFQQRQEIMKKEIKKIVEQLVRPTGLIDPIVEIRKLRQMDDLIKEVSKEQKKERTQLQINQKNGRRFSRLSI